METEDTSWMNQPRFGGEGDGTPKSDAWLEGKTSPSMLKAPLAPHMQRVVDEKTALDEKLTKLQTFLHDNPLLRQCSEAEQARLWEQSTVMLRYSMILADRIAAFPTPG